MKREKIQLKANEINSGLITSLVDKIAEIAGKRDFSILNLIFFINEQGQKFYEVRQFILDLLAQNLKEIPALSIIGQPPADGSYILIEAEVMTEKTEAVKINYHKIKEDIYCTKIETSELIEYQIFGITAAFTNAFFNDRVTYSFETLERTLKSFGLNIDNIVRQWNYVEDITGFTSREEGERQNYQVLNNVRHQYYSKYNFIHGYPAATGIGISSGGFILDCIAIKEKEDVKITPIKNPVQVSAYDYSEKVLIGSRKKEDFPKLTPKFERAKLYKSNTNHFFVLISGTAAIHNEVTISVGDTVQQTMVTLDNIQKLIGTSTGFLEAAGIKTKHVKYDYLRVYIKDIADYEKVKAICDGFSDYKPVYLVGDICRKELLVEIEGLASIYTF